MLIKRLKMVEFDRKNLNQSRKLIYFIFLDQIQSILKLLIKSGANLIDFVTTIVLDSKNWDRKFN